jgi:lycopene beta-cyclase
VTGADTSEAGPVVPDVVAPDVVAADVAVLGGGLAGGLVAYALARRRPEVRVVVVEPGPLGGNHVWSHFAADVDPADRWLVEPLVAHAWPDYDVCFPAHHRTLRMPYQSITSERFAEVVGAALPEGAVLRGCVASARPGEVRLEDGRRVAAAAVLDARGPGDASTLDLGWQKFLGRTLVTARPHGVVRPVVMDATVEQVDGYRFVYVLPVGECEVFVEDTYYSDTPHLDEEVLAARIDRYAAGRGWEVVDAPRTESGVLPVVLGGDIAGYWGSTGEDLAKAGMRAGLFHPTTGYSLPDAVRLAARVAEAPDLSHAALLELTRGTALGRWAERGFYRMLDTMLFRAAEPDQRYRVLERFYRLDPGLVGRFYAGRSTAADKARILSGRPPVPVRRAVRALLARG